jgi:nucleotide-binding universal stress UspA family protein
MDSGTDQAPVLFAYDGSEHAKSAIPEAARELSPGRHAIVLTVAHGLEPFAFAGAPFPEGVEDPAEGEARKVADEGARLAEQVGFEARPVVEQGEPIWERIVAAADEYDASMVVLGSHGRTGVPAVLLGSVASAVARHTDRSVMIVHMPSSHGG